jgi:hypothetical protein
MLMRKLAVVITTGLMLGGGFISAPSAFARHGHDKHFSLIGRFTDFDRDDRGRDGPSEGDKYSFKFDLFDYDHDWDDAGRGDGDCVLTEVDRHGGRHGDFTAKCKVVLKLDDGDLKLEDKVDRGDFRDGEVTLRVVDGTDDYRDPDGDVTFKFDGGQHDGRGHDDHKFRVDVDLD